MSLATDILAKHLKKPRHSTAVRESEHYASGYAWRRGVGRHAGCYGILTWQIPLAQIQTIIRDQLVTGQHDPILWPWVADDLPMRTRQVARAHARARREGWIISTRQLVKGLQITYRGERKRRQRRRVTR